MRIGAWQSVIAKVPYKMCIRDRDEDVFSDLKYIQVPTGIFHGKEDKICPFEMAGIMRENISNSQLFPFENAGQDVYKRQDYLRVPRKWDASSISRFMIGIGPVSSVFDIATFSLMWFVFGCNTAADPALVALFQAGWFVESLISQTLIIHLIRTPKIPFVQSRAALPVVLLTTVIMGIGILIPFTPRCV